MRYIAQCHVSDVSLIINCQICLTEFTLNIDTNQQPLGVFHGPTWGTVPESMKNHVTMLR